MGEALTVYGLQLTLGVIALFALWKDWKEYKKRSHRWGRPAQVVLACVTLLCVVLSLLDTHYNRESATAERDFLSKQVQQLRYDSRTANDGFRQSFGDLYQKFSELQAKVQTGQLLKQNASLLKEIARTKAELTATQAKLVQPKATPLATFPTQDVRSVPVTETAIARSGQIVPVSIDVYNPSDANALKGGVNVDICTVCSFASEPVGSMKIAGAPDTQREFPFDHIFQKSAMQELTLQLKVPSDVTRFGIGVRVNCETCTSPRYQQLWVTLR